MTKNDTKKKTTEQELEELKDEVAKLHKKMKMQGEVILDLIGQLRKLQPEEQPAETNKAERVRFG